MIGGSDSKALGKEIKAREGKGVGLARAKVWRLNIFGMIQNLCWCNYFFLGQA